MPHHGEAVAAAVPYVTSLPTYTVYREDATYYAVNNSTGAIDFTGADPAVVVQACLTAGGAGTVVGMREAIYVALTGVAATANNQGIYGMGEGTYWDATALLTGVHAFTISGFTGCELRNFAIETEAGGGKTCHCVFIEDGADNFHLIDITIIASDKDGIHIEGTTITQGHIHRCHIQGADEQGILVDMGVGDYMYRLHIEDCDIGNTGWGSINFMSCAGNWFCEVIDNVIYNSGGVGIGVSDFEYSTLRGNICVLGASQGMQITDTDHAQVTDNILYQNRHHGIYLYGANYCTVEGNICLENDFLNSGTRDGIYLQTSNKNLILGNQLQENDRWGIMVNDDSDWNKVSNNLTEGNTAGSINVNGAPCVGNQVEFNQVEEGAPVDTGTFTRSYGNFDPSADGFVGDKGAPPW
ncbi:hypothetical protein ES707_18162 [subsurface metagenome]